MGRYVGLISGIIAGIATYAGLNALDKAVNFTGLYPKLPPPLDKSAFTDDVLKTKPKYSPDPKKWIDNGGKVGIDKDGSWVYTDSAGNSVRYVNGYPDFSPYSIRDVQIDMTGDNPKDFRAANEAAGFGPNSEPPVTNMSKPPAGYTWHHCEDGTTMQLVPYILHKTFTRAGGVSILNS